MSDRLATDLTVLRLFQKGETNRAIDYLEADLEGSAMYMCGVIDENPRAKETVGYRSWILSAADYRAKHPRLHAVGSDWDRKVTRALTKALGPDMPPNTSLEPTATAPSVSTNK